MRLNADEASRLLRRGISLEVLGSFMMDSLPRVQVCKSLVHLTCY